jgi:hypothetical protein
MLSLIAPSHGSIFSSSVPGRKPVFFRQRRRGRVAMILLKRSANHGHFDGGRQRQNGLAGAGRAGQR